MKNKIFKYIAAICFFILAIEKFEVILDDGFSFRVLFMLVGFIVVVIAILTETPILSTIGFAPLIITSFDYLVGIIPLIPTYIEIFDVVYSVFLLSISIVNVVYSGLLMVAGIKTKYAKKLGLVAAIIRLVLYIFSVSAFAGVLVNIVGIHLTALWYIAGALFLGLTYDSISRKAMESKTTAGQNNNISTQRMIEDSNVENLMRLKSLLDEGTITQEEFDEKKKQLLGL